ncbi:MAG: xanthine dehydrogenase family protein molybdopterin-binding subunit [Chitinophagaceae bacterium]|nr:xanthine dehydrogenase family protein molybdopterin-binding subunit [Rubrivivax sp.]
MNAYSNDSDDSISVPMRRRGFLTGLLASGAWVIAPVAAAQATAASLSITGLSHWLQLEADGTLRVFTNVNDIGQGTWAALRAFVAHQLDLPVERVLVALAPIEPKFRNPAIRNHATFGSLGWRTGSRSLGPAAAAARELFLHAASARWGVPVEALLTREGAVWQQANPDVAPLRYEALLADVAALAPADNPVLRPTATMATPVPQHLAERINGRLRYGIDARPEGLLHAAVLHAPGFGARLKSVDDAAARRHPGVVKIVHLPDAVAVVAKTRWAALQAARLCKPAWTAAHPISSTAIRTQLLAAARRGRGRDLVLPSVKESAPKQAQDAFLQAHLVVDALFDVPFLPHLPMEPLNATVQVLPDRARVWLSTQSAQDTQAAVAVVLGLAPERVEMLVFPGGGGFGRRLEHDWVVQAAVIAREVPGQPIQLIWDRAAELQAGYFRPASAARVRLALDAQGRITGLRADIAQPSLLEHTGVTNPMGGLDPSLDWTASMGWFFQPYAMPALHLNWTRVEHGVPCAYWRSVGASQNQFFYECALDIAARKVDRDPIELRRELLAAHPRGLAFLQALLAHSGWHEQLPPGQARGIAMGAANGSISGHVVHVELVAPGRFRLLRITAAIDAGVVADASAVKAQVMGGTAFGLSAALATEISIKAGRVEQTGLLDAQVLQMRTMPPLDVHIVPSELRSGGVGEEGVPTIAPAIANALFALTGKPVHRLPLSRSGWQLA